MKTSCGSRRTEILNTSFAVLFSECHWMCRYFAVHLGRVVESVEEHGTFVCSPLATLVHIVSLVECWYNLTLGCIITQTITYSISNKGGVGQAVHPAVWHRQRSLHAMWPFLVLWQSSYIWSLLLLGQANRFKICISGSYFANSMREGGHISQTPPFIHHRYEMHEF